jgi:putative membrane protein
MIKNYVTRLVFIVAMVIIADRILKGFHIQSYIVAFWVALAMSILNTFVKPILTILTIPITILSLGLFYFVINVIIVYLASYLVEGFSVSGFLTPLIFSFMVSLANTLANMFVPND